MPIVFSKSDLKVQILIDLDYASKIDGPNSENAVHLARLLATQLSQEERAQIANFNDFAKIIDFERALDGL